jgi:hypothetical protein
MKRNVSSIFWGLLFILAGAALLADRMGWIKFSQISNNAWVYIFAALSLVFLLGYFLNGLRQWGWLFPTLIFAAISLTIWMSDHGLTGSYLGMPILLAIATPFYVGFAFHRRAWGLLIPAWVMTVLAFVAATAEMVNGDLIGAVFLFAIAAPFLVVYLWNHSHWWALIPAWVLFILGMIILLSGIIDDSLVGALFLFAVALPFLLVYLTKRSRTWALIPAAATALVGTIALLSSVVSGDWPGAAFMLLFSAAFFFVFFRRREYWWALIPAGVFASIGIVILLGMILPQDQPIFNGLLSGILLFGLALTFGILWLLRRIRPTAWAIYPAIGLFIAALAAFFSGGISDLIWATAILAAGIVLVLYSFLRKKPPIVQKPPEPEKPAEPEKPPENMPQSIEQEQDFPKV